MIQQLGSSGRDLSSLNLCPGLYAQKVSRIATVRFSLNDMVPFDFKVELIIGEESLGD